LALTVGDLDAASVGSAGALVAREHAAARRLRPELPASYDSAEACGVVLQRHLDSGYSGVVAVEDGRVVAVMTGMVRDNPVVGRYVRLPADGVAVDPDVVDPTRALAAVYRELAPRFVAAGVWRHYLTHVALPWLWEALSDLGFARDAVYAVQPAVPRRGVTGVEVRTASIEDLDTIARLSLVELRHRSTPPIYGPPDPRSVADLVVQHRALHEGGAVHFLARLDGQDVGLLTIELTSPAPRLCPDAQPYISPTATLPEARGRGVGHALVAAALDWAQVHGYRWVSVDFQSANPLSRPFWLGVGFRPTGYGAMRIIDPAYHLAAAGIESEP
jgi:GNAT superfamily N-acetyltransferase